MERKLSRYFQSTSKLQQSQYGKEAKVQDPTGVLPQGMKRDSGSLNNPLIIDGDDTEDEESNFPLQPRESKFPKLLISPENESTDHPTIDSHKNVASETVTQPTSSANPFAQFAFEKASAAIPSRPTRCWRSTNDSPKPTNISTNVHLTKSNTKTVSRKSKKETCAFVPMKSLSSEEQEKITRKWLSLVDPFAPLEARRFQVLVAARLHARCQEPSVRKAMAVLREAFHEFTVSTVAKSEPDILAHYITNLQYYNTKSKQIVKAANEIQDIFNGIVPEDETSLMTITGVGKVFADLLAFVNTKKAHETFFTNNTQGSVMDGEVSNIHSKADGPN